MSTSPNDFNARVIEEFHANGGHVGGSFENTPLLLLHHTGAKTGKARINPLGYLTDGDRYVIVASNGGSPTNPDWYHNLKANPRVSVEQLTETFDATAVEVDDEAERSRLYDLQVTRFPSFGDYKKATTRRIPVIELVRE